MEISERDKMASTAFNDEVFNINTNESSQLSRIQDNLKLAQIEKIKKASLAKIQKALVKKTEEVFRPMGNTEPFEHKVNRKDWRLQQMQDRMLQ